MPNVEILGEIEGPVEGYITVMVRAQASGGDSVARHTHPGTESTYILEGEELVMIDGHPDKLCKADDWFQVPAGVPHSVRIGPNGATMVGNYVISKGKPLASDACGPRSCSLRPAVAKVELILSVVCVPSQE